MPLRPQRITHVHIIRTISRREVRMRTCAFSCVHTCEHVSSKTLMLNVLLDFSILFLRRSLAAPGAHHFRQTSREASSQDLPISATPALGLQASATVDSFSKRVLGAKFRSSCLHNSLSTEPRPRLERSSVSSLAHCRNSPPPPPASASFLTLVIICPFIVPCCF